MSKKIRVKHTKAAGKFGMVVGIIFVCIGLFIAIPVFGLFGVFWTAIAAYGVYANYRDGFTDKPISGYEIDIDDSHSAENRLKNLESLYNQGLITREEYDAKRKEILNDI